MERTIEKQNKHILFCKCGGERAQQHNFEQTEEILKQVPIKVTTLSDLCGLRVNHPEQLEGLLKNDESFLVIGCYQRTMSRFIEKLGIPGENMDIQYLNLTESLHPEAIQESILNYTTQGNWGEHRLIKDDSDWPAWYPVIDYDRCTSCGQCADFCLFGVYEKTAPLVKVINPKGCKNNCPACARICPATAIIFPKYKNGGAIAGSDLIDERAEQQRQAMDIENFLGDDIYAALQQRKMKRQSIIREEAMKKALNERDQALNESEN